MSGDERHATVHDKFKQIVLITNGILVLLGIVINFTDIVSRNLFNSSLPWAHKITVWLIVLACYLSIGPQLKDNTHIRVEFLVEKFKGTPKYIIELISNICTLLFSLLAVISGILVITHTFQGSFTETMGSWHFPLWIIYLICFLIGIVIMTVYSIHLTVVSIKAMFFKVPGDAPSST